MPSLLSMAENGRFQVISHGAPPFRREQAAGTGSDRWPPDGGSPTLDGLI